MSTQFGNVPQNGLFPHKHSLLVHVNFCKCTIHFCHITPGITGH